MKLIFVLVTFAVLALGFSNARVLQSARLSIPKDKTIEDLVKGIERFSITFLLRTELDSENPGKNIVVSPYLAWSVLTLMCKGAEGHTLNEMASVLRHPKGQSKSPKMKQGLDIVEKAYVLDANNVNIKAKNFIFTDLEVSSKFKSSITPTCKTYVVSTRFDDPKVIEKINGEVYDATEGHLDSLVYKEDIEGSQIILANAMFFETMWTHPFNALFTTKKPFHDYANRQIGTVDMMMQKGKFKYASMDDFQVDVVEMPIGNKDRMCTIVLMPHKNVELKALYNKFSYIPIEKIFKTLDDAKNHKRDVELHFPRFSTTTDIVANKILNHMGMYDVFSTKYANLSGIADAKVALSRIIHLTRIDVTEGADFDISFETPNRFNSDVPKFVVDRPFMYLIIEKETNVIVVGGIFHGPESA